MTMDWLRPRSTIVIATALALLSARASRSQSGTQGARGAANSRREVRAELAATLLNSNRFAEAAAEYRRLLATDPTNRDYRLGLARALAWGDHPREAEHELVLVRDRQNAAVVEPLLRTVRAALDPTAAEAAVWLHESPTYLPYRVALARALAREDPRRAIAQFDTLRIAALGGAAQTPPETMLIREEADAYIAMGARTSAIMLLGVAVDQAPRDTSLRNSLASMLYDVGLFGASRSQYDTLITMAPTARAYLNRANAALAMHDTAAAEQDLERSSAMRATYEAYYLMASMAREREDYASARMLYSAARHIAPSASSEWEVAAAQGEMAREERPLVAFAPDFGADSGWTMMSQSAADNAGVSYLSMGARRSAPLGDGFVTDIALGVRRMAQSGSFGPPPAMGGTASAGIAQQVVVGPAMLGASVHAGVVAHPGVATFGRGSFLLGGWLDAWAVGLGLSREPAYESLFTPAALSLGDSETTALVANAATISAGGPVGPLDIAVNVTRTWLSDHNTVGSIDGFARVPLTDLSPYLFATYEGTMISYAMPTTLYWDPQHYASNAVGPEVAVHHARGLSWSARVLAGLASEIDRDTTADSLAVPPFGRRQPAAVPAGMQLIHRSALQLSTGAGADYRAAWWEGAADLAYGRARAGGYQRLSATFTMRVAP